jgi:hypothetical protein
MNSRALARIANARVHASLGMGPRDASAHRHEAGRKNASAIRPRQMKKEEADV